MKYSSEILLSKSALQHNIDFIRKYYCQHSRISSVIKADAYGHGIEAYVPMAEEVGIDHFAAFSYYEATKVKKVAKESTGIMIMGWIDDDYLETAIRGEYEFFVFEMQRLKDTIQISKNIGIKAKIHLELETGMNRTGINEDEIAEAMQLISDAKDSIEFTGLCTHLAGPESIANYVRVKSQITKFNEFYNQFTQQGLVPKYQHIANSAGTLTLPNARMNMVRLGIVQYGFWPSKETFISFAKTHEVTKQPLKRIITWKSKIMSIKDVDQGEFIGYGTSYLASDKIKIAIVPVGYSHGFSRSLSNRGRVIIKGERCAVVGLVNMNEMIIDITPTTDAKIGDDVILIGQQGDIEVSVSSFSDQSDQLNYEFLSQLPRAINRKIIE